MTRADARAALAACADRSARSAPPGGWPLLELLADAPAPPGWAVWRAGGPGGGLTALPALLPSAPFGVRWRYLARVVANTTGRCPLCSAVARITPDSPRPEHRAAWSVLPVRVGITHAPDCATTFTDDDRAHFDPRTLGEGL
jgi:hypothetical protein